MFPTTYTDMDDLIISVFITCGTSRWQIGGVWSGIREQSSRSTTELLSLKAAVRTAELRVAPLRRREEPSRSNFCTFCKGYRVVNIDAKVANGILDV
jgi:hypothetical protein